MAAYKTDANWPALGFVCPSCGNRGVDDAVWTSNGITPFRLLEDVARSWSFTARLKPDGRVVLVADADRDHVDWESGANRRIECVQCLAQFPLPAETSVEFE